MIETALYNHCKKRKTFSFLSALVGTQSTSQSLKLRPSHHFTRFIGTEVFQQCRCNANRVCKYELYRGNVLARVFQGIKCSNGCRKCSRYKCKKIGRRAKRRLVTYKCQL
ncbi:hypothetical protein P5673_025389 [Acropora cervicornis]|uniref:Uncharacterized protein n=1 Tax=Acropora cervicornis TaxID=6130 RepID=A0AAD9Q1V3_ACRCE|nr:hypothetical protein P5673_025389 [Acropora cervicornis]